MATCASVVNITVQLHKSCDSLCSCCTFMFCPRIAFLWMLWMHLDSCLNLERFYARAWKSIHTHTHIHICKHTQRREIVEGTHTHTNRNEPDSTPLLRLSAVRCCRQRSGHVRAFYSCATDVCIDEPLMGQWTFLYAYIYCMYICVRGV